MLWSFCWLWGPLKVVLCMSDFNVFIDEEHLWYCVFFLPYLQERVISMLFWTFGSLTRNLYPLPSWLTRQKRPFCCLIGWNWGWSDQRSLDWLTQVQLLLLCWNKHGSSITYCFLLLIIAHFSLSSAGSGASAAAAVCSVLWHSCVQHE